MHKRGVLILLSLVMVILLSGCKPTAQSETQMGASNKMLMPGTDYILFVDPKPYAPVHGISVAGGTSVSPIAGNGDWLLVEVQGQSGWLPSWYIINENDANSLASIQSDYMVVKANVPGFLNPGGPPIMELEKGRLVKPTLRWREWVQVSIISYSTPNISTVWIKDEFLGTSAEVKPIEGFLRVGSPTYDVQDWESIDPAYPSPEKVSYPMPVEIMKTQGEFSYVAGPGGWIYWVKTIDILFEMGQP